MLQLQPLEFLPLSFHEKNLLVKTKADVDKLGIALAKLAEEDPTFTVKTNLETGQTVISGMGELHLDIIMDRLKREFHVECNQGAPQVNYKECITQEVEHRELFKKQSGGRGKYADIQVKVGPADEGKEGDSYEILQLNENIPKDELEQYLEQNPQVKKIVNLISDPKEDAIENCVTIHDI